MDKKSGSNYFGLCPFHSEDTPSFSVSPSKQIYYCFGCNKGGDVIHFIMDIEKCSYPEAIRKLADQAGVAIPESDDGQYRQKAELNKQMLAINLEAAKHFYLNLTGEGGKHALAYLQKRGLQGSTVKRFGMGFALDSWNNLYDALRGQGFSEDLLMRSGLFKKGKTGKPYDLFRNRLMFPIMDVMGRVVAFGGRVLDDSMPKYINSPESPVYTKGRHLFGLNLAKHSKQKTILIVEGYMDAISLYQAGIDNVVASLGTALTEQQAHLLRKYTETVVIAYDADAAGQAAALRSLDICVDKGLKVSVLQIPEGKDPDDYIRKNGPERFHALVEKALPLIDYKLFSSRRQHSPGDKLDILAYQDEACNILAKQDNAIVRELYAAKLSEQLGAGTETVLREIERRRQNPQGDRQKDRLRQTLKVREPADSEPNQEASASREELYLICLLATDDDIWDQLADKPTVDDFSEGVMQDLAKKILPMAQDRRLDSASLIDAGQGISVHGRPLHDLLARAMMRLEETFGRQELGKAAAEQLKRQRIIRLRQQCNSLKCQIEAKTDVNTTPLKEELRQMTRRLIDMKSGVDNI